MPYFVFFETNFKENLGSLEWHHGSCFLAVPAYFVISQTEGLLLILSSMLVYLYQCLTLNVIFLWKKLVETTLLKNDN